MSSEVHVLFRGALPHLKALSRAMDELAFPFKVRYSHGSMEQQRGFMTMWFRREETGVEFDVFDGRAAVEELAGKEINPAFDRSGNFRWSGDEDEMLAGLCAAAALAKLVDGIVFEEQEARLLSVDEAIALARETLQSALKQRRPRRPGTRPADIKRYLKALLNERSDLALVDRLLFIRPVRHIIRGVVFDRTHDRYRFATHCFVRGLCFADDYGASGSGNVVGRALESVWQPLFEPVLMEALARHVFDRIGKITTFGDLAACTSDGGLPSEHVTLMLLSGERERAEEYIRQFEEHHPAFRNWAKVERSRLADITAVCAESHAREASAAKALKIEHAWEPSPFPVELPAAERRRRSAEPLFSPTPWVERRSELFRELPEHPGEIVFAMDSLEPGGHEVLVAPLTREQAEERHRNSEPYVLAARLPAGRIVLLCWQGEDRNDPSRSPKSASYSSLRLHSSDVIVRATFFIVIDRDEMLRLRSFFSGSDRKPVRDLRIREGVLQLCDIDVFLGYDRKHSWEWRGSAWEARETICDQRGERKVIETQLTSVEIDRLTCPRVGFGEFDAPLAMVLNVLRSRGYGEVD